MCGSRSPACGSWSTSRPAGDLPALHRAHLQPAPWNPTNFSRSESSEAEQVHAQEAQQLAGADAVAQGQLPDELARQGAVEEGLPLSEWDYLPLSE